MVHARTSLPELSVGFLAMALGGVALAFAQPEPAQAPTVLRVLARATEHVTVLHRQLFGIVAEERYDQRYRAPSGGGFGAGRGDLHERRRLRSDYLLVQPEGENRHYGFRDVFEVDGRAVRDREERLATLFLQSSLSSRRQIQGVLNESARYNIGDVERNINTPTLALLFLHADYKPRFEFTPATDTSPSLGIDRPEPIDGLWVLSYEESWPTTVIRGRGGGNRPATGRYWIDPDTGEVLVSELVFEDADMKATISVSYSPDEAMGHLVPTEMRERYENRQHRSRVEGTATYSRFRRFRVEVQEGPTTR